MSCLGPLAPHTSFGSSAAHDGYALAGAALATAGAELISFCAYITYMFRRQLLTLTSLIRVPKVKDLLPLFRGGLAVQLRSLALNLGLLSITRATITMDPAGTASPSPPLDILPRLPRRGCVFLVVRAHLVRPMAVHSARRVRTAYICSSVMMTIHSAASAPLPGVRGAAAITMPGSLQGEYRAGGRTHTPSRVAPPAAARQLHLLTYLLTAAAGTMAAAHTITVNLWQLAGVVLLALSSVATILIPQVLNSQKGSRGLLAAKKAGDRLLLWGLVVGLLLGVMQVRCLPGHSTAAPTHTLEHLSTSHARTHSTS